MAAASESEELLQSRRANGPFRKSDATFGEKTTLCGCCADPIICLYACCCLPCLMSSNSAHLDGNENLCICCYPGLPSKNRFQAITQFGGQPTCADCCIGWIFPWCSETQVYREIKMRKRKSDGPQKQSME